MKRDIKDYLHLYLGCDCQQMGQDLETKVYKLTGISYDGSQRKWWAYFENEENMYAAIEDVFPILRPLSDMTEEEAVDVAIIMYGQPDSVKWRMEDKGNYFNVYRKHYSASFTIDKASGDIDRYSKEGDQMDLQTTLQHHFITRYMLSKGFDLFGLIEAGLAIDKTTLKQEA